MSKETWGLKLRYTQSIIKKYVYKIYIIHNNKDLNPKPVIKPTNKVTRNRTHQQHHKLALQHMKGVRFRMDPESDRVGVYTTQAIKHAMAMLLNTLLRQSRIHIRKPLVTVDSSNILRLREQLNIYSYQFKMATNTFQQDRCVISGKVGGMKDDVCIALQLGVYFTELDSQKS
jgi:hypothetical protein